MIRARIQKLFDTLNDKMLLKIEQQRFGTMI